MKTTVWKVLAVGICAAAMMARADDMSATNAMPQPTITPQDFAWKATTAGLKEVRLGEFAEQNSTNAAVKKFAKRMVRDHSAANKKLMKIAQAENLNLPGTNSFYVYVPEDPVKEATQLLSQTPEDELKAEQIAAQNLEKMSGVEFDAAYADAMVRDHVDAVQLFENATNLPDKDLKKFAEKTLPTLREHYQMAQELQNKVGGMTMTNSNGVANSGVNIGNWPVLH